MYSSIPFWPNRSAIKATAGFWVQTSIRSEEPWRKLIILCQKFANDFHRQGFRNLSIIHIPNHILQRDKSAFQSSTSSVEKFRTAQNSCNGVCFRFPFVNDGDALLSSFATAFEANSS